MGTFIDRIKRLYDKIIFRRDYEAAPDGDFVQQNPLALGDSSTVNNSDDDDAVSIISIDLNKPEYLTFLKFLGPGYLIAVGYMDPGNWSTDLAGGSHFGYTLLFVVLLSSLTAMMLQSLCVKLGVVTGHDLAEHCRMAFSKRTAFVLYLLAEIAIIATDLAEVIGSAIALNLLFGLPHSWGVIITGLDVIVILYWWGKKYQRYYEVAVIVLVTVIGICFIVQLTYTKPQIGPLLFGLLPNPIIITDVNMFLVAIGILGATVMPHNLYFHSNICQQRKIRIRRTSGIVMGRIMDNTGENDLDELQDSVNHSPMSAISSGLSVADNVYMEKELTIKFAVWDTIIALIFAWMINSLILIVSASAFYASDRKMNVDDIAEAYHMLNKYVYPGIGTVFAVALLASGQSSTITGTLAGQMVMSGFLKMTVQPWLRRLVTRLIAIIPALVTVLVVGEEGLNQLIIISQVILSFQLPFAIIPLVMFTSSPEVMGGSPLKTSYKWWRRRTVEDMDTESRLMLSGGERFVNSARHHWLGVFIASVVSVLNAYLVVAGLNDILSKK
ncbi:hypothetical protein MP638_000808 [Amoeboaphelidium occidentale]|nr:hypothetical protein MP638_000808 [Amoeboaphelidium occidentale]